MKMQENLLFALYTRLDMPDKLTTIRGVVRHFNGRYNSMWDLLTTKYGNTVEVVLSGQWHHQHTPNGNNFKKKEKKKGTPTIVLNASITAQENLRLLKEIDDRKYPWEEGRSNANDGKLTREELYAEMEQEIMDYYSVVEPRKMENAETLRDKYIAKDRDKLEELLVRKYFRKSLHLWMRKKGGYNRGEILDEKEQLLHNPEVIAAAADVSRRDLLSSVQEFYRTVRPDLVGDHAKETVNRWSRFPEDLVERMVKKYLPTSAYRWMLRSHRREEKQKILERMRLQKNNGKDIKVDF